jgi:hypothetical protein
MKLLGKLQNDFFSIISSNICVTSSGKTEQTGGALFLDLPANMIGRYVQVLVLDY